MAAAAAATAEPWTTLSLDNWRSLAPGEERVFVLKGTAVLLRHRTEAETAHARQSPLADLVAPQVWLRDPIDPRRVIRTDIPATNAAIGFGPGDRFVLLAYDCDAFTPAPIRNAGMHGDFGGFFCMRYATHHDSAGRGLAKPGIGKAHNLATLAVDASGDSLVIRGAHLWLRDQAMRQALG